MLCNTHPDAQRPQTPSAHWLFTVPVHGLVRKRQLQAGSEFRVLVLCLCILFGPAGPWHLKGTGGNPKAKVYGPRLGRPSHTTNVLNRLQCLSRPRLVQIAMWIPHCSGEEERTGYKNLPEEYEQCHPPIEHKCHGDGLYPNFIPLT